MKTNMGDPHRNFVDFSHVPVVKRLTRMPVAIDPSHSVGLRSRAADGLLDIFHVVAQGVVAGANMILADFHPEPARALVDGAQALLLSELRPFLDDIALARECYERRVALTREQRSAR
jgi:3-deoxy-7-phosphoheptulonate synthase